LRGEWDYHDAQGNWIEVPRVINGRVAGPGTVTSGAFNGMRVDPGWTRIEVQGSFDTLEVRGAEDDGARRGVPGAWGAWTEVSGTDIPPALAGSQYLSYRIGLSAGDEVTQVDLTVATDIRDAHPRLLVDDLDDLRARCTGALSHQCDQNAMFAGSDHLTNPLGGYSESQLARIAKVMAFQYLMTSQPVHADRVREVLLQLSSYDRQHWSDLRDQIQDLGLGWIGLSWMLALDWAFEGLRGHPADLQAIADGTAVFVDYLLEMYKHVDFNNHFYLGRSPVLLAGLALYEEGLCDADALRYLTEGFDFLFNHEHPAMNVVAGETGGWHESLGYFDGEMGYPMAVDMDGLRTAAGLDFFQDSSFWRTLPSWYLHSTVPWDRTIVHWADQGKDRWSLALDGSQSEGKGVREYLTAVHQNLGRLGYPEAEQAQCLLDDYIGVFYDSGNYAESYYKVAHLNDVLWYQPGAPAGGLRAGRRSTHFESLGEVILREGNQPDDAMAMFACADFRGGHQQADNGHFSIWYRGYLAVDSGYYDGWGSSHHMNYARRTIAHNTLTVTMPGESFTNTDHNDGGQQRGCNTTYYNLPAESPDCDECNMYLSGRTDPWFDFIGADFTASYDPAKMNRVTREFVVFDRVDSTDASYPKRFLLHGRGPFVEAGGAWHVDDGQGRLFLNTLLPAGAQVVQVGGSGHEWEIDGVNYPPSRGDEFAGTHRLEISPPTAATSDNFLHVLQVADQTAGSMDAATPLTATGATGVLVGDWVVWFGTAGSIDGLSYEIDAGRPLHVIVGDLQPQSAYQIRVGDQTFTESSDQNGVLFFEDDRTDRHSVDVGAGTCPDADGDSYLDAACGGSDCDDSAAAVHPGAMEQCDDGIDNDCDGLTDSADLQDCGGSDGGPTDAGGDGGVTDDGGDTAADAGDDAGAGSDGDASNGGRILGSGCGGCSTSSSSAGSLVLIVLLACWLRRRRMTPILFLVLILSIFPGCSRGSSSPDGGADADGISQEDGGDAGGFADLDLGEGFGILVPAGTQVCNMSGYADEVQEYRHKGRIALRPGLIRLPRDQKEVEADWIEEIERFRGRLRSRKRCRRRPGPGPGSGDSQRRPLQRHPPFHAAGAVAGSAKHGGRGAAKVQHLPVRSVRSPGGGDRHRGRGRAADELPLSGPQSDHRDPIHGMPVPTGFRILPQGRPEPGRPGYLPPGLHLRQPLQHRPEIADRAGPSASRRGGDPGAGRRLLRRGRLPAHPALLP
jgi:hypothetical protein